MHHVIIVDGAISSNPLIVWNNSFGVDDPFSEKPADLHKQNPKTFRESKFK